MELEDLVVIGDKAFVITKMFTDTVQLSALTLTGNPVFDVMLIPRDRVLAVGTYRRVE